jgi:hypothetical protein
MLFGKFLDQQSELHQIAGDVEVVSLLQAGVGAHAGLSGVGLRSATT